LVLSGVCSKVTIQLSYAMGISEPISLMVNTHNTGKVSDKEIEKPVKSLFDLSPAGIIEKLDLLRPIYRKTATLRSFWA